MGFTAEAPLSEQDIKDAEAADGFAPIDAGNYDVTITGMELKHYGAEAKNAGKPYINVKLRIVEDSDKYAKRVLFAQVPLFSRWAPTPKSPAGAVTNYFQFFSAVGVSRAQIASGQNLPGMDELGGKRISVYVQKREPDERNPQGSNQVGRFSESKTQGSSAVPADVWGPATPSAPTPSQDVWGGGNNALQEAALSGAAAY